VTARDLRLPVDFALAWVARSVKLIPLIPGTNRPAIKDWPNQASDDPAVIRAWYADNPDYGIGALTGSVNPALGLVIDVDTKFGDGMAELRSWLAHENLVIPDTMWASTPNGGWHIYLSTPPGVKVPTSDLENVDFQGDGVFVAVPPTRAALKQRAWPPPDGAPGYDELCLMLGENTRRRPLYGVYQLAGPPRVAPCPPELLEALGRLPSRSTRRGGVSGNGQAPGGFVLPPTEMLLEHGVSKPRDDSMAALAARLVAQGSTWEQAYPVLRAVAAKSTLTYPWSDENLRAKFDSAKAKGFGVAPELPPGAAEWAQSTMATAPDVSMVSGTVVQTPPAPVAQQQPRTPVDCGDGRGPEVIRAVGAALNSRAIPQTYVTEGRVVAVQAVTGSSDADPDGKRPLPVAVAPVDANTLAALLAWFTFTYRLVVDKAKNTRRVEFTPEARMLTAALALKSWTGLPPLNGIIGAPVLRRDGTLLQQPGYDPGTGLILAPRVDIYPVPLPPPAEAVAWARTLLLDQVLRDFPWCGPADRANYVAMLVTQVLRRRLGGSPVPFFPITATDQGSGKTLLATIAGVLYGQASMVWTGDEDELRKTLTSIMRSQEGVITFDNIPEGTVIRSGTLSKLLTDRTWGDRLLGGNVLGKFANDRLWCATGNNLRLGGDMATRAVLISLDANTPHPERRSGFVIPDLESWIEQSASQRLVLTALLVLAADWSAAGCPEADVMPMRQFTAWARMCGGFLARHGVGGFLANTSELEDADDDAADWAQFLARWPSVLGEAWVTSSQVADTLGDPRWAGTFPAGRDGPLSVKSLGRRLGGIRGRYYGSIALERWMSRDHIWLWRTKTTQI
jgi:hypothetical protein